MSDENTVDFTENPKLKLFTGNTGGVDSWLTGKKSRQVADRLSELPGNPLSCSQLNQLLALSHQAELSEGFFRYYWLAEPKHVYDVKHLPGYDEIYQSLTKIQTLDQLSWGMYRLYVDSLLCFGGIRTGYRWLRNKRFPELEQFFDGQAYDTDALLRRGPALPMNLIARDDRYLIAEMACKSFEPTNNEQDVEMILRGAWIEHKTATGGTRIKAKALLEGACVLNGIQDRQQQLQFAVDELLEEEISSEEDLKDKYSRLRNRWSGARDSALANTDLYLSMANDLDVYVATSMRTREQFRNMANTCDTIFNHSAVKHLNLRYFDPTLSAARGHEDKGLIECLMVKCAKVLLYMAGEKDSYGKDAEAAMALSLGKPVIFLCDNTARLNFFSEVHPLSRLIEFKTGVAVGAMAASEIDDVALLLNRIFSNKMEYALDHSRQGYFRLKERLTGSTVRLQTNDMMLRETFWNCYHRAKR